MAVRVAMAAMAEGIQVVRPMCAWRAAILHVGTLMMSCTVTASWIGVPAIGSQPYAVIGMTNIPEAKLAREAEICYATVAMVTDFCLLRTRKGLSDWWRISRVTSPASMNLVRSTPTARSTTR